MGQCHSSSPPSLTYHVDADKDLGLELFGISDSIAYNRGCFGGSTQTIKGVEGVTCPQDYFPSLKKKRRASQDDALCRLSNFILAAQGCPRGATAKLLLTTKAPRLTQTGPPTLDIIFQDQTKVRVGYQPMPKDSSFSLSDNHKEDNNNNSNSWMATSIHFGQETRPRYRVQMTRNNFPFLVQLFDGKTNTIYVSILTYGAQKNTPRTIHAFQGNVATVAKAKQEYFGALFGVLNEEAGVLGFQDGLRKDDEKAAFCIMFLLRTRLLTFNGDW